MKKAIILILMLTMFSAFLHCEFVGKVIKITGGKQLYRSIIKLETGEIIKEETDVAFKDYLSTGEKTEALIRLKFDNVETDIRLKEKTKIRIIKKVKMVKCSGIKLVFGRLWSLFKGKKKNGYAVETHNSVAGVEGTEFEVSYDEKTKLSSLIVISGKVKFTAKAGLSKIGIIFPKKEKIVNAGQTAIVSGFGKFSINKSTKNTIYEEKSDKNSFMTPLPDADYESTGEHNVMFKLVAKAQGKPGSMTKPVKIWINGCNTVNGEEIQQRNGNFNINGLEPSSEYEITLRTGGYNYSESFVTGDSDLTTKYIVFIRNLITLRLREGTPENKIKSEDKSYYDLQKNPDNLKFFVENNEIPFISGRDERLTPDKQFLLYPTEFEFYYLESNGPLTLTVKTAHNKIVGVDSIDKKFKSEKFTINIYLKGKLLQENTPQK